MTAADSIRVAFRCGVGRLWRRSTLVASAVMVLFALLIALSEHQASAPHAADRGLLALGSVGVPLFAFLVARRQASGSLQAAVFPLARFGHARENVALGFVGASALLTVGVSALTGLLLLAVTRALGGASPLEAGVFSDAPTVIWVVGLGALAYAAWFGLATLVGPRTPWVFLVVDWLMGGARTLGLVTPRAPLAHLLGDATSIAFSQRMSSLALFVATACVLGLVWFVARDRRA